MALNWRNCSGCEGECHRCAYWGAPLLSLQETKRKVEREQRCKEGSGNAEEVNTKTPKLRGTEIVLF